MTNSAQHMAAGKVAVMNLLSDDEVAKVSTVEGGMKLVAGDHFQKISEMKALQSVAA